MGNYYLAIDISATGGRHVLGYLKDGKLELEEVHRFDNGVHEKAGELVWDYEYLFREIKTGLVKCREIKKLPIFVGIDTRGEDFVLLNEDGNLIGNHFTIDPLMSIMEKHPEYLEKAETLLMVPDYFNYLLTGIRRCEYSNALTTQLVSSDTKNWDWELLKSLGYPTSIFPQLCKPGTILGNLRLEVNEEIGYDLIVVLPAAHETASASVAGNIIYAESTEGTVIGNILVQMMASHEVSDLSAARECVKDSYEINEYHEGSF